MVGPPPVRDYNTREGKAQYERELLLWRMQGDYERAVGNYASLSDQALLKNLEGQANRSTPRKRYAQFNYDALYLEAQKRGLVSPKIDPASLSTEYINVFAAEHQDKAALFTSQPVETITPNNPEFSPALLLGGALLAYFLWNGSK